MNSGCWHHCTQIGDPRKERERDAENSSGLGAWGTFPELMQNSVIKRENESTQMRTCTENATKKQLPNSTETAEITAEITPKTSQEMSSNNADRN